MLYCKYGWYMFIDENLLNNKLLQISFSTLIIAY